jgi:hypothetical protein
VHETSAGHCLPRAAVKTNREHRDVIIQKQIKAKAAAVPELHRREHMTRLREG